MGLLRDYINKKKNKSDDDDKDSGVIGALLPKYHKGGVVRNTGPALLKKGERVLTKTQQRKRGGK